MNQKVTDLHDEFEIDHQVFLAHFQRLELSNAKLEKKIRDEQKTDLSDTAIHRLRSGDKKKISLAQAQALGQVFEIPFQLLLLSSDLQIIKTTCCKVSSGHELHKLCLLAEVIYLNIFVEPELATQRAAVLKALKIFDHMRNINVKNDERSDYSILETEYELRDAIDILQNSTALDSDGQKNSSISIYCGFGFQLLPGEIILHEDEDTSGEPVIDHERSYMHWYAFASRLRPKEEPSELQKKHTEVAIQRRETEGYAAALYIVIQEDEGERIVTEYDVDPFRLSDKKSPLFLENITRIKASKEILYEHLETLKEADFIDEKARQLFREEEANRTAETSKFGGL